MLKQCSNFPPQLLLEEKVQYSVWFYPQNFQNISKIILKIYYYFNFSGILNEDPYTLKGLEPNTDYNYKAGACTHYDVCAYTDVANFKTAELSTNSGNLPTFEKLAILAPSIFIRFFSQRLL